jgi:hypothetical protein
MCIKIAPPDEFMLAQLFHARQLAAVLPERHPLTTSMGRSLIGSYRPSPLSRILLPLSPDATSSAAVVEANPPITDPSASMNMHKQQQQHYTHALSVAKDLLITTLSCIQLTCELWFLSSHSMLEQDTCMLDTCTRHYNSVIGYRDEAA